MAYATGRPCEGAVGRARGPSPTILTCLLLLTLFVPIGAQSSAPAPQARPTFRAGVDLVTFDVVVLDKNRHPVRGLTAADFRVREDRDAQEVVSVSEVVVPPVNRGTAAWTRDVGPDVVENDVADKRFVVLVLDDANGKISFRENPLTLTRRAGHALIDELGPNDLGAVVFTHLGKFENFTADKRRLHAAVDDFRPRNDDNEFGAGPPVGCVTRLPGLGRGSSEDGSACQINALTKVAEALQGAAGRKLVAFISAGIKGPDNALENPDGPAVLAPLKTMFERLQQNNVTVYTIDPRGLTISKPEPTVDVATGTGGRRIEQTNAPERLVPAIFEENSVYYVIGYRSTHLKTDGRLRNVSVSVARPGLTVLARSGYFGPTKASTSASKKPAAQPIDVALVGGVPTGDLRLGVQVAAFAVPGKRDAAVLSTIAITDPIGTDPGAPVTHAVELVNIAYDKGWRGSTAYRQTSSVTRTPGVDDPAHYELASRLSLKPGRYEVRFAANSDRRAGSVYLSLEVPDFAKDPLSLSGLVMTTAASRRAPVGASFKDVLPVVPTTRRTFTRLDEPSAFLRVYQGGDKPPRSVEMTSSIRDASDHVVVTRTSTIEPRAFTTARAADYQLGVPIATLLPGEYLLAIQARVDDERQERAVRFTVE